MNNQYNERRYKQKIQWYRFTFGLQQMKNHPMVNFLWIVYVAGLITLVWGEKKLFKFIEVPSLIEPLFRWCMMPLVIILPIICAVGLCQFVGNLFAKNDEAKMCLVFGSKRDVKNQPPILIRKKRDRKSNVTIREFYTTIPMKRWKENKDAICDILDSRMIGDILYGGKKHNKGNRIYFESAKGRITTEREIMYDDEF
jgi:hypothetical protein